MRSFTGAILALTILCLAAIPLGSEAFFFPSNHAIDQLDAFINAQDSHYQYHLVSKQELPTYSVLKVRMTSQEYLPDVTDSPVWEHDVIIVVPQNLQNTKRAVVLGLSGAPESDSVDPLQIYYAEATGSVVAIVYQALNQPQRVKQQDGSWSEPLTEDALIAALWAKYIYEGQDSRFMGHWAMAKAMVRGMDTIQSVARDELSLNIEDFVLSGFSKHGWQTYFTAAADRRVAGIVPVVIDVLDFGNAVKRIKSSLCGWPVALTPYIQFGFDSYLDTPQFDDLATLLDPLSYNRRLLRVRKFLVSASSDQFFLTATENVGYKDLAGPTYFHEVMNGGHGFHDILPQLQVLLYNIPVPTISAFRIPRFDGSVKLVITRVDPLLPSPIDEPQDVRLWTANNPNARDFRLPSLPSDPMPPAFTPSAESINPSFSFGPLSSYSVEVPAQSGYTAFNVEFTYLNPVDPNLPPLKFNTNSYVNPADPPCAA